MTHKKEESSDDILKPKYPPTQDMKPSEREDEEWEDELTGEKLDNPYLPSQRLAEFGMEDDMYPPKI